jgi:hypothetical protein
MSVPTTLNSIPLHVFGLLTYQSIPVTRKLGDTLHHACGVDGVVSVDPQSE